MPVKGAVEWNSAEGRVVLDVVPLEVLGALTRLRVRLLQRIDAIPQAGAEMPTRCTEWRAVDLVNHLADTTHWAADAIDAAVAGRSSSTDLFAGFDVVTTPKQLTDAAARDLDQARARLHAAMGANLRQVPRAVAVVDQLTPTPLGPQPFAVAALHVLWDTWLHERDLLPASPNAQAPEHEDEVRLCALYTLRLLGLMQAMFHRERTIVLQLHGATTATLRLDSREGETLVRVIDAGEVDGTTPILSGDAATVVDALTGRGDIATALEGPAEARRGLSPLSRFLAGR